MSKQIYVNLPVKDLQRSIVFFSKLGFTVNPQFTNENGACLIVSDAIYVMLLVEKFFKTFTSKEICDTTKATEVLVYVTCDSRNEVDNLVAQALVAGGSAPRSPQDHGFMYGHGFEDLDGHTWELVQMQANPDRKP